VPVTVERQGGPIQRRWFDMATITDFHTRYCSICSMMVWARRSGLSEPYNGTDNRCPVSTEADGVAAVAGITWQ
jgi:hypothetical protein